MDYYWITNINEFEEIAKEWDKTLIASSEDNPFLLSDFILTWWKYYSQNLKLRILVFRKNRDIIGGLPLCQYKNGSIEHIGGINANYTEFLSLKDNPSLWGIFFGALQQIEDWRCVSIKRFRKSKLDSAELELVASKQKDFLFNVDKSDYTYLINIPETSENYIKGLSMNLRYFIRRSERRLSKLGRLDFFSLKDRNQIDDLCSKYIELSRDSFKRRNRQSTFEDKTYCMFFKELINKSYNAGYLDANVLKLNDRIIAIHFGYSIGNNLNYVFPTFDMDFAYLKPGYLLITKLVELGSIRKNRLLDLYVGWRRYKEELCDYKEEIFSIELRPNCLRSKIESKIIGKITRSSMLKNSKKALQSYPRLAHSIRKTKALFRNYV